MDTSALSSQDWQLVCKLFDELASRPPDERSIETLEHPEALVGTLIQMLAAHDSPDPQLLDDTIQSIAGRMGSLTAEKTVLDHSQQRFGPWRALEEVGRGGMAVVLRGERADGRFEKEVAIKLLPTADAEFERERLLEEIRILARLEHPNIAHLIDGGISESGIPYLVMEYVRGQPITDYCKQQGLDITERIRLLAQVIEAVSHAHRHLVVHCDLKPGNILVSEDGRVKLVDFGIAALISKRTGRSSAPRELICSPGHAAPEQLRGAPPAISQDVFSLGAVLYLLLCDQPIRDNRSATRLLFTSPVLEETITPPSQRARDHRIDQDLDAVCSKALDPDPAHRYASTSEMHADLKAWLACRPVSARMGGIHYRSQKWLRRHWLQASAFSAVVLALTVGSAVALWQAQEARTQAATALVESTRAQATRDFLVELFASNDPDVAQGQMPTARDLLDQGARRIQGAFADAPHLRAEMKVLLGDLYQKIGEFDSARPLLEQALVLAEAAGDINTRVDALRWLGWIDANHGRHEQALIAMAEAEQLLEQASLVPGTRHSELMRTLRYTLDGAGRFDQALARSEAALALARNDPSLPPVALFNYLWAYGNGLLQAGKPEQAEAAFREALALELDAAGAASQRMHAHLVLASALERRGELLGALEQQRQALEIAEQIYPPIHGAHALTLNNLGLTLSGLGRLEEAEAALRQALEVNQAIYSNAANRNLLSNYHNLGVVLFRAERYAEAEPIMVRARELRAELAGRDNPSYASAIANLGDLMMQLGRFDEAEALIEETLEIRQRILGADHRMVGSTLSLLASLRIAQGRPDEALQFVEQGETLYRQIGHEAPSSLLWLLMDRGRALALLERNDEAAFTFAKAVELGQAAGADAGVAWPRLLDFHLQFLIRQQSPDALAAAELALQAHRQTFGGIHPATQRMEKLVAQSGLETH